MTGKSNTIARYVKQLGGKDSLISNCLGYTALLEWVKHYYCVFEYASFITTAVCILL